eukprot:5099700-Amphidinium_carterae.1
MAAFRNALRTSVEASTVLPCLSALTASIRPTRWAFAQLAFLPLGLANRLSAENHSARKRLARFALLWGCVPKGFF